MENKKKTNFFLNLLRHPMITAIFGTLIGGLVTYQVTAINVEKATVELMSSRLAIVEENDTLEQAINKVNKEVDKKNSDIEERTEELKKKDQEIAELTEQLNDDTEIKKLKIEIETIQKERDDLRLERDQLQREKEELQKKYDELEQKKYDEFVNEQKASTSISIGNLEVLKNDHIRTQNSGDVSVNGTAVSYYLDTSYDNASIEYKLDNKYSEFKGRVYISKSAYEHYSSDDPKIVNASISIEVKYDSSDTYQEIDSKSGLLADSDPVEIGGSVIGATRLRIVFRGAVCPWGSVIRMGDPVLYKASPE